MTEYLIKATVEQLEGLKHALFRTQAEYEHALPQREEGVRFWEQQPDNAPGKERYLAMARENLEYARTRAALVEGALASVNAAKLVPMRAGRKGTRS